MAEHISRAKDIGIVREAQKPIGRIKAIFGWLAVMLVIFSVFFSIRSCRAKADMTKCQNIDADWVKIPTGFYRGDDGKCIAGTPPSPPTPAPPAMVTPAERAKTPRTFDVPQEGLRVWLEGSPEIFPKLGGVRVETPSGRSYIDLPGVDLYPGYEPPGIYTFRPDPPGSERKVQIYNRW